MRLAVGHQLNRQRQIGPVGRRPAAVPDPFLVAIPQSKLADTIKQSDRDLGLGAVDLRESQSFESSVAKTIFDPLERRLASAAALDTAADEPQQGGLARLGGGKAARAIPFLSRWILGSA